MAFEPSDLAVEVFEVNGDNLNIQAIELRYQANKGEPL